MTVTIERSEFARNGSDGYTHNIYIGNANRLNVIASHFHEAKVGHNLKSRAKENFIENSYFMDGPTGTSSYLLDFPDGGVVFMRGNLFTRTAGKQLRCGFIWSRAQLVDSEHGDDDPQHRG